MNTAAPTTARRRLHGLDLARALALLGMVAVHTIPLLNETGDPQPIAILSGKAAALFAVLAGFSVTLATRKYHRKSHATAALISRGLLIAGIGAVLGTLPSGVAVILVNYGVMFMLAPLVLHLSTRALAFLTPTWLLVSPVVSFWVRNFAGTDSHTVMPHLANLTDPATYAAIFLTGYYPVLQWFGYLLAGLLLSRLDWSRAATAVRTTLVGGFAALAAYGTSAILLTLGGYETLQELSEDRAPGTWGSIASTMFTGSYGTVPTDSWWWLAAPGPHTNTPVDMVATAGTSLLVIGLCMLLFRHASAHGSVMRVALATGSMPLTLYTAHVVLLLFTSSFLVHALVLVAFAGLWAAHVKQPGPLEFGVTRVVRNVLDKAGHGK